MTALDMGEQSQKEVNHTAQWSK